jgi:hypothetical protein
MVITLTKYSSNDNVVVLTTTSPVSLISIKDFSGNVFSVNQFTQSNYGTGYVIVFNSTNTNLSNPNSELRIDLSKVAVVTATGSNGVYASSAMYDSSEFLMVKMDMINALKNDSSNRYYKYLVRFSFLELALMDLGKHGGDIGDISNMYDELILVYKMFKTKYHYNEL